MISLAQRLRELNDAEFESFVHQFLLSRFPGAGIKKVDGVGGDRGLDSFSGELSDGPSVWQCKHFSDRIRQPQKAQILSSIKTAFDSWRPKRWTLCIPIDLRSNEHEWFQTSVAKPYRNLGKIEIISASDFLQELAHNRQLRDAFFPDNAIANALGIRKMAIGSESKSAQYQEQLTVETAQQFLEGRLNLEPRLHPVLRIGLSRTLQRDQPVPGAVFSETKESLAVDYFPRDPKSYNLDPIGLKVTLDRKHSEVLEAALNIGFPCKLPAGALLRVDSSSALLKELFGSQDCSRLELEVSPAVPDGLRHKEIPLRLVAGTFPNRSEISYVPFKVSRVGRKEVTLISTSRLPVDVSIRMQAPPQKEVSVVISPRISGADAVDLNAVLDFLSVLEESGQLEIFSLDPPSPFVRDVCEFSNDLNVHPGLRTLVSNASMIAKFFKTSIRIPVEISRIDKENIEVLRCMVTGEPFPGTQITLQIVKKSTYAENFLQFIEGPPASIRLENPPNWQQIPLFGQTIDCGEVTMVADAVEVVDKEGTRKEYANAPDGATVTVHAKCEGTFRFIQAQKPSELPVEPSPCIPIQCS